MANPVVVSIPLDTWVKVATNVTIGAIWPIQRRALYYHTIRDTGGAAPTDGDLSEAKELPYDGATIRNSVAIDVYIACKRSAGQVRVDL